MDPIEYNGYNHIWKYSGPWLYYLIAFYLSLPVLAYIILPALTRKRKFSRKKSATLFVLGDIGHSPRMCYHAQSLSKLDYYVTICGYLESQPSETILEDANIEIQEIKVIHNTAGLPYLIFAIQKILLQCIQLVQLMFKTGSVDFIIIQNPPLIPITLIAVLYRYTISRTTKVIIDWHNLNYTILNLKYNNESHPVVRILKLYEKFVGKFGDFHFTVTDQMKLYLIDDFKFPAKNIYTLRDRPGSNFKPIGDLEVTKADLFNEIAFLKDKNIPPNYKILVTATSFTPDEDLNILLDSLKLYDSDENNLPPIALIVTGKGPLKQQFEARSKELKFLNKVRIETAWLSYEDYPLVLACADLAVSLHTSSSGIDLPMKIVDFFGCGVPVITLSFPAIGELVQNDINGIVIPESKDPSESIYLAIKKCFANDEYLPILSKGAILESKIRWDENWRKATNGLFD